MTISKTTSNDHGAGIWDTLDRKIDEININGNNDGVSNLVVHEQAHTAMGLTTKTISGTSNQIIVTGPDGSGNVALSTPQNLATGSAVQFGSVKSVTVSPTNVPTVAAGVGAGTSPTILAQPTTGHSPRFSEVLLVAGTAPPGGVILTYTFPTALPGAGAVGKVFFMNGTTNAVSSGAFARTSSTTGTITSSLGLTAGVLYTIQLEVFPY